MFQYSPLIVEGLNPLVEEDVEKNGSEDQPGLQEAVLGVLVVAAHHGHLGCPGLLQRQLLDVLDVVDLVGLLDGGVGHLGCVQVLGVDSHPGQAGPEDAVLDEPAELAGVLPLLAILPSVPSMLHVVLIIYALI